MADIDLAQAYQDFADLMAEMGFEGDPYCITLDVWNHRHGTPQVTVTLSAMLGPSGCQQAYDKGSLDEAFAAMRATLGELKAQRDGTQMTTQLGVVAVPDAEKASSADDIPF